jgi:riboflavin kinase/FMN adenylyltransferase
MMMNIQSAATSGLATTWDDVLQAREALRAGQPEDVLHLLGRYWTVEAPVEHGDARGRTMGFPTANMHLEDADFLAFGIYAVRINILKGDGIGHRYDGVANFGIRPMYRITCPLLEAHLFDFDGDLYGLTLKVELIAFLRAESVFTSLEALIVQIAADAALARAILQASQPLKNALGEAMPPG